MKHFLNFLDLTNNNHSHRGMFCIMIRPTSIMQQQKPPLRSRTQQGSFNLAFSLHKKAFSKGQYSSFKYFRVVRIEKQICPFVFWEKLRLDKFVSRSTDL